MGGGAGAFWVILSARMARKTKGKENDISLGQYQHSKPKRANNPQVGLVSSDLDSKPKKKIYQHDPYISPTLSWAGKAEGVSFDVDTVSLHIHERIDPKRIIKQVLIKTEEKPQLSLFEQPSENLNTEKEFDFYGHTKNWSNRLIAGDSLLVMNSLLEKEKMAEKVQMIYIDPPYGIKYNSNFQPFVNKKEVKDNNDDDIPAEPEMIKAFRDTWELDIHSYLTYLRDRLLLSRELLHESGSIFVQISDENVHHVRELMDEVFRERTEIEIKKGFSRKDENATPFRSDDLSSYDEVQMARLETAGRITSDRKFAKILPTDFPFTELHNVWLDTVFGHQKLQEKVYVVQTNKKVIARCLLLCTDPGDLVFDPTCGGGTTAFVAEQWGRRWITCDTSRVAIQLAKQRLMTGQFDYFEMAQLEEGISSGFKYKNVPHITLGSIANNESAKEETLYDQPIVVKNKVRVTGPFTVEAVPGIRTKPIDGKLPDVSDKTNPTNPISEKLSDYLDNIRSSGIRSYHNKGITFNSVEVAEGFNEIHAFGSVDVGNGWFQKCVLVFGPDYAPMEQTQVERTMDEVRTMAEKPQLVIFCSYAFDPEASKDIDNIKITGLQILKAQMNTDLLTRDLKKKVNTNRPFWLIGEPDIEIHKIKDSKYQVEVKGFDYYDPHTQELKAGSTDKIAVWMLDTDYDNRSLFPSQIFFPMQDEKRDWTKLAKALNGTVDEELLEQYTGTTSIPFKLGEKKTIAVKIVDDRGVEMLIVKKI